MLIHIHGVPFNVSTFDVETSTFSINRAPKKEFDKIRGLMHSVDSSYIETTLKVLGKVFRTEVQFVRKSRGMFCTYPVNETMPIEHLIFNELQYEKHDRTLSQHLLNVVIKEELEATCKEYVKALPYNLA